MIRLSFPFLSFLILITSVAVSQDEREKQVKDDRDAFAQDEYWIYNDLDLGIATAKKTGKPLLVAFR